MARLNTCGFEWADTTADRYTTVGTAATIDTANKRSGANCAKCVVASTGSSLVEFAVTSSSTVHYYFRGYINLSNLPSGVAGTDIYSVAFPRTSTGVLGGDLQVNPDGSWSWAPTSFTSAAGVFSAGSWALVEIDVMINTSSGASSTIEARVNGSSSGSQSGQGTNPLASFRFGVATGGSPGGVTAYIDDVAINDSTGAAQNSWAGSGKIVLLRPISLNTNGGSWTDDAAATTSAALTNAVDNTPPKGIADTTAGGGDHQVRNAAANTSLDMNMTTYSTAGISSTDTINVLEPQVNVGAPVSTGAKSGSFGISSNPVISNRAFTGGSGTGTFFWRGAAAGTYPSNWGWERGTVTYGSSVTVGNSPVARLTITGGTTSRIAMCDAMGLYVDYTPASPKSLVFPPRTARNSLLRR